MKTIKEKIISNINISRSEFITIIKYIDNKDLVKDVLKKIKEEYKDANHYCYAYIIGEAKKASDDGEPSNTAGIPILNVLEKEQLTNIICVVIRYFGGIKLGAGGLVRAYTKAVTSALITSNTCNLELGSKIVLTFNYELTNTIDYLLKDCLVIDKSFIDYVTYTIHITESDYLKVKDELIKFTNTIYEKEKVFILK